LVIAICFLVFFFIQKNSPKIVQFSSEEISRDFNSLVNPITNNELSVENLHPHFEVEINNPPRGILLHVVPFKSKLQEMGIAHIKLIISPEPSQYILQYQDKSREIIKSGFTVSQEGETLVINMYLNDDSSLITLSDIQLSSELELILVQALTLQKYKHADTTIDAVLEEGSATFADIWKNSRAPLFSIKRT
jgi:hypothetical protein